MTKVIAECCQNHLGDREILRDMIWAAAECGADIVKIQSMRANDLTRRERFEKGLVIDGRVRVMKRPYAPEYERLRPLDLSDEDHWWFIEECARAQIQPLTTVFTRDRIPFLASLPWREIKVASYDCASSPMLMELRERFDHLYVSTGATEDAEIEAAAAILDLESFTFLHCVSVYPCPLEMLNLNRLAYLRQFTDSVGFSDHSLTSKDGLKAAAVALLLGANVIERHFTILQEDQTRDGPISVDPRLLRDLVALAHRQAAELQDYVREHVPEYQAMLGSSTRDLTDQERLNRHYYRGRFASHVGDRIVYNSEDDSLEPAP